MGNARFEYPKGPVIKPQLRNSAGIFGKGQFTPAYPIPA